MKLETPSPHIAVVGHTNTGKTSLLRTLARDPRFGEVDDRPATTQSVQAIDLLDADGVAIRLFDTPGLEDALSLAALLHKEMAPGDDPVPHIRRFVEGDHGNGRFEQEARVLRQMLHSDAALYVIDAREPVLPKHRAELRLLAECGRPILPLLNFVAVDGANPDAWRSQLAHSGLHWVTAFDTVVFDFDAEVRVFDALAALLDAQRTRMQALVRHRREQRHAQLRAATLAIAGLLVDAAGLRTPLPKDAEASTAREALRDRLRQAEDDCVTLLLQLFSFELGAYQAPALPLKEGRWRLDLFDAETARALGIRGGSGAVAGGAAGMGVDLFSGGLSLGAGTVVGAAVGALFGLGEDLGRATLDRMRGQHTLVVAPDTLQILATRQLQLLAALLRRGHASQQPLKALSSGRHPAAIGRLLRRARAHPEWSRLNGGAGDSSAAERVRRQLAEALEAALQPDVTSAEAQPAASQVSGSVQYRPSSDPPPHDPARHDQ